MPDNKGVAIWLLGCSRLLLGGVFYVVAYWPTSKDPTSKSQWYLSLSRVLNYPWHCDVHSLNLPSTGVVMTKEHVLGTNVQNHNSRTPPIIMAPRRRCDWRVMWGRSEKYRLCLPGSLLFSTSSEDSGRMTIIYVCVFVSDFLSIWTCVIAIRPSIHTVVHEWRKSLRSAICLDVTFCFLVM